MTSAVGLLDFTDHLGVPLQEGLLLVHNTLVRLKLRHRVKIGRAGKVIGAFDIAHNSALGADWCNFARGFMFDWGRACRCRLAKRVRAPRAGRHRTRSARRRCLCPTKPSACTAFTKTRCLR